MVNKTCLLLKDIISLLVYYFIYFISMEIINLFQIKDRFLFEIVTLIVPLLIICFKNYKELKTNLNDFIKNFKTYIKKYLIIGIIGIIIMNLLTIIINKTTNILVTNESSIRYYMKNSNIIFVIIASGILTPLFEETIFRLNFKNIIKSKYLFLLTTSILFSLMHILSIQNTIELLYLIPYITMGFTLGFIYYDSNNIFNSILIHCINNIGTIIIYILLGVI